MKRKPKDSSKRKVSMAKLRKNEKSRHLRHAATLPPLMSSPSPAPAAAAGAKEPRKRRVESKKKGGKGGDKKKKKDIADTNLPEEDIVWETVVVPHETKDGDQDVDEEDNEADALNLAETLASDDGLPTRATDIEDDSDDFDAPQDGTIKRLVQSVKNRKRQTGRGHQLPPEERARERELEAKRRAKAEKRRRRKEEGEATSATATKGSDGQESGGQKDGDKDSKSGDVLEIDLKEQQLLKPRKEGSEGPKKKTLRMTKAEKEIYRNAHRALLLAYVAHLRQLSNAADSEELQALLLSLLAAPEWPKRDAKGVPHADVPLLLALCRWVRVTFGVPDEAVSDAKGAESAATAAAERQGNAVKEEEEEEEEKPLISETPKKKRKAVAPKPKDSHPPEKKRSSSGRAAAERTKEALKTADDADDFEEAPAKRKQQQQQQQKEKETKKKKKHSGGRKAKKQREDGDDDESDFEIQERESDEDEEEGNDDGEEEEEEGVAIKEEEEEEKPLVGDEGKKEKKKRSPKAAASPLKTQVEPVQPSSMPAWTEKWWEQQLLTIARKERTATRKEQQVLYVSLLRALGIDARCVCSVAATPLAKTREFSLTPEKDEEAAGKPYPAHGNDLALDMYWAEVYSPQLHRWVSVDASLSLVNKPQHPESTLNSGSRRGFTSLAYVLGIDRRGALRDVTRRYAKSYASVACALRTESDWWNRTQSLLSPAPDAEAAERDRDEEAELAMKEAETGEFPTSKELYRKHPLYVLEKFVGKFDIIYPKDKPLGYCGQDPIWPRSAVHHLHTQDGWLKEGREVRIGEVPIKRVPKRQRKKKEGAGGGEELKPLDTELFGLWQTEPYQRPIATNGIVPKNAHGNVYLYQKWMLPIGCVHVNLPQIARTCRYLKVDYAQALVNWEPRGGFNCPVFDGVVICEEHYAAVREAWEEHYSRRVAKEVVEQRKRAITLWRKFANGLVIRERLKRTYSTAEPEGEEGAGGEEAEGVRQLPTLANMARHVHSFGPGSQDESGKWSKTCACGYSVQYEEI